MTGCLLPAKLMRVNCDNHVCQSLGGAYVSGMTNVVIIHSTKLMQLNCDRCFCHSFRKAYASELWQKLLSFTQQSLCE